MTRLHEPCQPIVCHKFIQPPPRRHLFTHAAPPLAYADAGARRTRPLLLRQLQQQRQQQQQPQQPQPRRGLATNPSIATTTMTTTAAVASSSSSSAAASVTEQLIGLEAAHGAHNHAPLLVVYSIM